MEKPSYTPDIQAEITINKNENLEITKIIEEIKTAFTNVNPEAFRGTGNI